MKKWKILAGVLAGAAVLAGCQNVDTNLSINEELSGSRVMSFAISASDMSQYVSVTPAELDQIVVSHLPPALTYSPLTLSGDSYSASLTLDFSSPQDYERQVVELLAAGGVDLIPVVSINVLDSVFSSGVRVEENYTSSDLLQWLDNAVTEAQVVTASYSGSLFTPDKNVVTFGGQTIDSYSPQIAIDTTTPSGMAEVDVETRYEAENSWSRTVKLTMGNNVYLEMKEKANQYFAEHTPSGVVITEANSDWGHVWTAEFAPQTPEELTEATNELLSSTDSTFEIEAGGAVEGQPARSIIIGDQIDCSQICNTDLSLINHLVVPDSWTLPTDSPAYLEMTDSGSAVSIPDTGVVQMQEYFPLDSVSVSTKVKEDASVEMVFSYRVPAAIASEHTKIFEEAFGHDLDGVYIETKKGDDNWEYVTTLSSADIAGMNNLLSQYLPGSYLNLVSDKSFFTSSFAGDQTINLEGLLQGASVTGGVTYSVEVPVLHSFAKKQDSPSDTYFGYELYSSPIQTESVSATGLAFVASGPTAAALITYGALALVALTLLVLGVVFRKRLGQAAQKRRLRRQEPAARLGTSVPVQSQSASAGSAHALSTFDTEFSPMRETAQEGLSTPPQPSAAPAQRPAANQATFAVPAVPAEVSDFPASQDQKGEGELY